MKSTCERSRLVACLCLRPLMSFARPFRWAWTGKSRRLAGPSCSLPQTLHARFRKYWDVVKSGVSDLSTNTKHLEGFVEE